MDEPKLDTLDEKATLRQETWVARRDAEVARAVESHNHAELRRLSTRPGGYGSRESRRRAWLELLHVDKVKKVAQTPPHAQRYAKPDSGAETVVYTPHPDEDQVSLDTRRSFVTYPRGLSPDDKVAMQEDLQALIVAVLQRHPRLSYFQGFHDIMTVLYLTLLSKVPRPRTGETAEDRQEWDQLVRAASVVSLCRTRDAMGKGLGPMMGLLRLLRRLLAAADPQLYRISAAISPVPTLPFFALSWILTLFSHDVDTLEPVQRIFDYLISRNPISAIYLAVAILMAKKRQMLKLVTELGPEARRDPSLLHPLFARLPPLYPDTPTAPTPPAGYKLPDSGPHEGPNPYSPIPLSTVFALADRLQTKHPWNGPKVRGHEVLGPGSVVNTFATEMGDAELDKDADWNLADAENYIDAEVVLPGGDELDDDDGLTRPDWPIVSLSRSVLGLRPFDRLGAVFAIGVVVLGVTAAVFGWQGRGHGWHRWWAVVAGQWMTRSRELGLLSYLPRSLRDAL